MNYIVLKNNSIFKYFYVMKKFVRSSRRIGYFKTYLAYYCFSAQEVQWGFKGLEVTWTQFVGGFKL